MRKSMVTKLTLFLILIMAGSLISVILTKNVAVISATKMEETFSQDKQKDELEKLHKSVILDSQGDGRINHTHHDDEGEAINLYLRVPVLCWVMTQESNHHRKAIHVKRTWGKRCNKLVFISDKDDPTLPSYNISEKGRDHLTAKTMQAFDKFYKEDIDDYDWFLKADDDTYVVMENLRYFLASKKHTDAIYFGHVFKVLVDQGYPSGGGGYVISKEALRRYGNRQEGQCAKDHGSEDVKFGRCMQALGVKLGDSTDQEGRTRFHCFNPGTHIHGAFPGWYLKYDKYGGQKGIANISDYAITFHYISPQFMYELEFFIYHIRPYGIHHKSATRG